MLIEKSDDGLIIKINIHVGSSDITGGKNWDKIEMLEIIF